jgi:hypothetical protein
MDFSQGPFRWLTISNEKFRSRFPFTNSPIHTPEPETYR